MHQTLYFYLMIDVIIVGGGIAGTTLAWQWHLQGKSIAWYADNVQASSHVAAGVINPVVLKRFSPVWKAQEQLEVLFPFYTQVEQYLNVSIINVIPVWRRLHDPKEETTWIRKSKREDLSPFMQPETVKQNVEGIEANCNYGVVKHTGWLDTTSYMQESMRYFKERGEFIEGRLDHDQLHVQDEYVTYGDKIARHIIYADGMRLQENPFFKQLPIQGNKGEVLIIKCPGLELKQIIKSSVFLMPYHDDLYWVGATYSREFNNDQPTAASKEYLLSKLDTFLKLPYTIVSHKSGIRPTTIDRRPFIGHHHNHRNMHVFNGMGSRASLIAPWASHVLFNSMYNGSAIPEEMDIARFNP